jgi:hypothetical protein
MGASSVCELCEVEAAMAYRVNGMAYDSYFEKF